MQNIRKMSALLGAGAIILTLAGCADKNKDGQAETPAAPGEMTNAAADNLGDTANAAANGVGKVGNAVAGAGGAVVNAASNTGQSMANGAANATNAAANAGGSMANGAANAGGAMANGASNMAAGAGALAMTPKIKTAFGGEKGLNGSNINVNSDAATKTVTLNGTVKSAQQKTLASAIAKKNATGMTIKNNLTVAK